jgi:hypothetical protein
MTAILSTNNIAGRDNIAPAPALKENGENYPWRMFFDNNQRIVDADTTVELLDYLIDGYQVLNTEERHEARINLARGVQQLARGVIASQVEPDDVSDWEWSILVYGDQEAGLDPYGWGDGTGELGKYDPEVIDVWSSKHQLVLLESTYAPYTDIARPMSSEGDYKYVKNIIWLEPEHEEDFLRSLSRIGFITFGQPAAIIAPLPQ